MLENVFILQVLVLYVGVHGYCCVEFYWCDTLLCSAAHISGATKQIGSTCLYVPAGYTGMSQ